MVRGSARQCSECLKWGFFQGFTCAGCRDWRKKYPGRGRCRRCRHVQHLGVDGFCRSCLIALREAGGLDPAPDDVLLPQPTQLAVWWAGLPTAEAQPLAKSDRRRRKHPRRTLLLTPAPKPRRDDPQVIPSAMAGQTTLFTMPRTITSDHLDRIGDRTWPEWETLTAVVAQVAAERQVSESWRRMVHRQLRGVLSIRDANGEVLVVDEEILDEVPRGVLGGTTEVLRRAGLLRPRRRPRPPRWPVGSCQHCDCWGVTGRLCPGCRSWGRPNLGLHCPPGQCGRCRRSPLPVSTEYGLCRACLIHVREQGTEDRPGFTQLQIAVGGRLARQLRNLDGTLGYSEVVLFPNLMCGFRWSGMGWSCRGSLDSLPVG
ncbi:hypothetical protein ABZ928_53230, partial [Streptomyces sp. NPDC046909]